MPVTLGIAVIDKQTSRVGSKPCKAQVKEASKGRSRAHTGVKAGQTPLSRASCVLWLQPHSPAKSQILGSAVRQALPRMAMSLQGPGQAACAGRGRAHTGAASGVQQSSTPPGVVGRMP